MIIYLLRLAISSVFLIYASLRDLVEREVSDLVWLASIPLCLLLDFIGSFLGSISLFYLIVSLAISFVLGFSLCYFGFYGGADAKALLLIAAGMPMFLKTPIFLMDVLIFPIFFVFLFSTIFSISFPIMVLVLNIIDFLNGKKLLQGIEEKGVLKRFVLYFMARRVQLGDLKGSLKFFPAEKITLEENGRIKREISLFVRADADIDREVETLEKYGEMLKDGVLASPTIPMIVFLTVGYIFTILMQLYL